MDKKRPIDDKRIHHLDNEEKFFSLIEQRYQDLGYELIETCAPVQQKKIHDFSRKRMHKDKDIRDETVNRISPEIVFAY